MDILATLEHTLLKADATPDAIAKLCQEARENHLGGVCVNGCYAALAKRLLADSAVRLVVVVGFPLGADSSAVKAEAAKTAVADGAAEIDMVINIGALKAGAYAEVVQDIQAVVAAAAPQKVKVIIECCLLSDAEKLQAVQLIAQAGAAFVKTSTGFSSGGATIADVKLLAAAAKNLGLSVKAAGGIRDLASVRAMLAAGATRIGTSSGQHIAQELKA